jgi:hypothetical protein
MSSIEIVVYIILYIIYMSSIDIVESMHGLQTERGLKHHRGPCCAPLQDASPPKPKTIAAVRQAAESI